MAVAVQVNQALQFCVASNEIIPTKLFKKKLLLFLKLKLQVLYKLIRRYKYLEKPFEDNLKKILVFLKGYKDDERKKLAIITGIILSQNLCTAKVLASLFEEHLIKEGIVGSVYFSFQPVLHNWYNEGCSRCEKYFKKITKVI